MTAPQDPIAPVDSRIDRSEGDILRALGEVAIRNSFSVEHLARTEGNESASRAAQSVELLRLTIGQRVCFVLLEAHGLRRSAELLLELADQLPTVKVHKPLILLEGSECKYRYYERPSFQISPVIRALHDFGKDIDAPRMFGSIPNAASARVQQELLATVEKESKGEWGDFHALGWLAMASGLSAEFIEDALSFLKSHAHLVYDLRSPLAEMRNFLSRDEGEQTRAFAQIQVAIQHFSNSHHRGVNFTWSKDCAEVISHGEKHFENFSESFSGAILAHFFQQSRQLGELFRLIEVCDASGRQPTEIHDALTDISLLPDDARFTLARFMNTFLSVVQDRAAHRILIERISQVPESTPIIICAGYRHKEGIMRAINELNGN